MVRSSLLIGVSMLTLAGAAAAQSTTTDGANNRRTVNCAAADPANSCIVNNSTATDTSNVSNSGSATATAGSGNRVSITQVGNQLSAAGTATGSFNNIDVSQGPVGSPANNDSATVTARGAFNSATVRQSGNNNSAGIAQTGTRTIASGNRGEIFQGDANNSATIAQTRTGADTATENFSQINQARFDDTSGFPMANPMGRRNVATSSQNGTNLHSFVLQAEYGGIGSSADDNRASVSQTGNGSLSSVQQGGRGDTATVTMGGGGENGGIGSQLRNDSSVQQFNTRVIRNADGTFSAGFGTGNTVSGNRADVAIIGLQNSSSLLQIGVNQTATISMLGGGAGNTSLGDASAAGLPADRREGNTSDVQQRGINNSYQISVGGRSTTNPNGARGNLATVRQGDSATPSDVSNARDMRAVIFQRGTADTVSINQQNNTYQRTTSVFFPGGGSTLVETIVQSGSTADVSQLSRGSTVTIQQNGTNSASVTQGLNRDDTGGRSSLVLTQTDAGEGAAIPSSDPFGGGSGNPTATRNTFTSAQYGTDNSADVVQNTINGSATLFQARGSLNNTLVIRQGAGETNHPGQGTSGAATNNLTTSVTQTGQGGRVVSTQDGTNNAASISQAGARTSADTATDSHNFAVVTQSGNFQSGTINQSGFSQIATVDQQATNGTSSRPTLATIIQTGSANYGSVFQDQSAGASQAGDPAGGPANNSAFLDARPAGANSAEAVIIQSATRNRAIIAQFGRGQFARITQSGSFNSATIVQDIDATNSVAIVEQSGDRNVYSLFQDTAGAYIRVQQTGDDNTATSTMTFRGP